MNEEETLTPQGRLQLAQNNIIHRYSKIVALIDSSNIELKIKTDRENETRNTDAGIPDLGQAQIMWRS